MLVRNVRHEDITNALNKTNEDFGDNIKFRRFDPAGRTRQGDNKFTVTLTVVSSFEVGSRRSNTGRRIASACWHVYGRFMDHLPEQAEIVSSFPTRHITKPGDDWQDWNVGSFFQPLPMSLACECNDWNVGGVIHFPIGD